jgi:hypothetical protein
VSEATLVLLKLILQIKTQACVIKKAARVALMKQQITDQWTFR